MQRNLLYALMALAAIFSSSSMERPRPPKTKLVLLIIGHDISLSFLHSELKPTHILSAISALQEAAGGGKVAFSLIGDRHGQPADTFLTHRIVELPKCDGRVGSDRIRCQGAYKREKEASDKAAEAFAKRCSLEMSRPATAYTDLNGFLKKCATLAHQPQYRDYQIVLFINSDGYHDTVVKGKRDRQLVCPSFPPNARIFTSGWKNTANCDAQANYVQAGEFFEDFPRLINQ